MSAAPINDGSVLVDRIMAVMDAAFDPAYGEAWNRRQITDALVLPSTHALILDPSGQLIPETAYPGAQSAAAQTPAGFVLSRHGADEEELLLIAVAPEYRRNGSAMFPKCPPALPICANNACAGFVLFFMCPQDAET